MMKQFIGLIILASIVANPAYPQISQGPTPKARPLTERSETSVRQKYTQEQMQEMGYSYEVELAEDIICPSMEMYNPKTKQTQWVSKIKKRLPDGRIVREPIIIPKGSRVAVRETEDDNINYKEFMVVAVPGPDGMEAGCLNPCRWVDISTKIKKEEKVEPPPQPTKREEPPPVTVEPPPVVVTPTPTPLKQTCIPCQEVVGLRGKKERGDSVKRGLAKTARNTVISGGGSWLIGLITNLSNWQGPVIATGIAFVGGMIADWANPSVISVQVRYGGAWVDMPLEPDEFTFCDYRIRTWVEDTEFGKVARVGVVGWQHVQGCDLSLPIPKNTNNVFAFAVPIGVEKDKDEPKEPEEDKKDRKTFARDKKKDRDRDKNFDKRDYSKHEPKHTRKRRVFENDHDRKDHDRKDDTVRKDYRRNYDDREDNNKRGDHDRYAKKDEKKDYRDDRKKDSKPKWSYDRKEDKKDYANNHNGGDDKNRGNDKNYRNDDKPKFDYKKKGGKIDGSKSGRGNPFDNVDLYGGGSRENR